MRPLRGPNDDISSTYPHINVGDEDLLPWLTISLPGSEMFLVAQAGVRACGEPKQQLITRERGGAHDRGLQS